jgi:hypothetical protein
MTSQGSAYGRLRRGLQQRSVVVAMSAAGELDHVSLADALELVLLLAEAGDARYPRAAARWHGRLATERGLGLVDSQLVAASLAALVTSEHSRGVHVLRDVLERVGLRDLVISLDRATPRG